MGIVYEFKKFNAELKNPNWSVSSISLKNELVVSLWGHNPLLSKHPTERKQIYRDRIDRWSGHGSNELKRNLDITLKEKLKVRVIISLLNKKEDFKYILEGEDASKYPKKFHAKTDWIGDLKVWDGINFEIEFQFEY